MKKILLSILLLCLAMTGPYAQLPKWCNPPLLYDWGTQSSTTVPTPNPPYHTPPAAAYDNNGNLVLYLSGGSILDGNGNFIDGGGGSPINESAFIKVPNTCKDYYLIWTPLGYIGTAATLAYKRISWNGSGWTTQPTVTFNNLQAQGQGTIAVSRQLPNGNRYLFSHAINGLNRFLISNSGITHNATITTTGNSAFQTEAELFESASSKIYACAQRDKILIVRMDANYNYLSQVSFPITNQNQVYGLEFANIFEVLFSSDNKAGKLNILNGAISYFPNLPGGHHLGQSNIERVPNGKHYVMASNNFLTELNPNTMTSTVTSINYAPAITAVLGDKKLPDQVDVEPYTANYAADLVIKDEPLDIGIEPLPSGLNGALGDIWNCQVFQTCQISQNPQSTATNYMRVRVSNMGCRASDPAQLRMYWTRGRSGETWTEHWFDPSIEPNNVINGHPAGGEITVLPGTATSSPISVPSIAAGQSAIFTKSWQVPNKFWYPINGSTDNGPDPMICYLARISSATDPMTNEVSPSPIDVNVINNNNIATRNSFIIVFNPLGPTVVRDGSFMINNPAIASQPVTGIEITGAGPFDMINNVEYIYLELEEELYNLWKAHGSAGTGVTDLGENRVRIDNYEHAELQNLDIAPGQEYTIVPIVKLIDGVTFDQETTLHTFMINHRDIDGRSISPGVYYIKYGTVFSSGEIDAQLALQAHIEEAGVVKVYPNPFRDVIETDCPEHFAGGRLNIYNSLGQLVSSHPLPSAHNSIDGRMLPAGLYLFEFIHEAYRSTLKVSKE